MTGPDLATWLREQCAEYMFDLGGMFRRESETARWPLRASSTTDLEQQLAERGHLLPLPKESAALANVLEVSIVNFLLARLDRLGGVDIRRGSERGYPDLEVTSAVFGAGCHAIDVKAARRSVKDPTRTQSRITLYTGNTYFKHPDLHWPGTPRPFNEYVGHLDLIMVYTLNVRSLGRVEDLEVIVQEPWRIASKERSSTTREYIGAVEQISALRDGLGAFATAEAFYRYWRAFPFKVSQQVQKQYQRALAVQGAELEQLRAAQLPRHD